MLHFYVVVLVEGVVVGDVVVVGAVVMCVRAYPECFCPIYLFSLE